MNLAYCFLPLCSKILSAHILLDKQNLFLIKNLKLYFPRQDKYHPCHCQQYIKLYRDVVSFIQDHCIFMKLLIMCCVLVIFIGSTEFVSREIFNFEIYQFTVCPDVSCNRRTRVGIHNGFKCAKLAAMKKKVHHCTNTFSHILLTN